MYNKELAHQNDSIIHPCCCCCLAEFLVHSRAVTDPTTEHHGEDHLKDLDKKQNSVIQFRLYSCTCNS